MWEKTSPAIRRREVLICLRVPVAPESREDILRQMQELIDFGINNNDFSQADVDNTLRSMGYSGIEDYLDHVPLEPEDRENFYNRIVAMRNIPEIEGFNEKLLAIIRTEIFGFDYEKEFEKLKALCQERGIKHKDFEPRNFIILWDFKRDRPLPREPDEPKLFVIDWEPMPKIPIKRKGR